MHKARKNLVQFVNVAPLLVLAASLSIIVVAGQLSLDLGQPTYYAVEQSTSGDNELESQDRISQLALSSSVDQLWPQIASSAMGGGGYEPAVSLNEAIIYGQIQDALSEALLRRQARLHSEKSDQQTELIDYLNKIKQDEYEKSTEDEQKIISPVNNPLEFEATARLLKHLPPANISSPSDLMSLDTLLSIYLNNLVKDIDNESKLTESSSRGEDQPGSGARDEKQSKTTTSRLAQEQQQRPEQSTTPASRYGNAEYIDHPLAIIGHQYVQGGAGEGKQLLGPDGTFENVQVVKTDHAVPSYCDPPNPCPIGFTAEDGCLENFVNSASSSREYQAKQQCSCDNEHSLFNCASPISTLKGDLYSSESDGTTTTLSHLDSHKQDDDNDNRVDHSHGESTGNGRLETLARTIQNRFGSLSSIQHLIGAHDKSSNSLLN